ncbi:DNA processing protein DprA [Staphylococcus auricularis]|uniref:DNA-protecting protein DprA n=1 Tax=Staphylococcus auricularis TaxID=29379 RepID=A0AAP8PQV0_9STAP|nr:DNA-processing protein DprA [Staphylococcus auricularis]PNZ69534.1 DNA-protecting protein DprA [Staphylococcus auricularis]QPT05471.1 DNA-protecting protein DprA [Staphylococcus auricularis]BCU52141.1 DNA processing protein DprA [Staphylococcus auricularis]SQJ10587.1 DprA SMF protein DNA processing factor [Staphylococcus auricularis]
MVYQHTSIDYIYLKLRFAGYTTAQIYRILDYAPDFVTYDAHAQYEVLTKLATSFRIKMDDELRARYRTLKIDDLLSYLKRCETQFITIHHPHYPSLLTQIYDPPLVLFYRGKLQLLNHTKTLAIVGSRHATRYTYDALNAFFPSFKASKLTIVSGLAKGADHFAHQLALAYHLPTIAVLGFGHMCHYPHMTKETRQLIEREGLVISEYLPETPPRKFHFPQRNRLISGLSRGVLVTEARKNSGTHITTQYAVDQNREVYILPGTIFDPMTEGNLLSAQQGAKIVSNVEDIIEDFQYVE